MTPLDNVTANGIVRNTINMQNMKVWGHVTQKILKMKLDALKLNFVPHKPIS